MCRIVETTRVLPRQAQDSKIQHRKEFSAASSMNGPQGMLSTSHGEERMPQLVQDAVIDKTTACASRLLLLPLCSLKHDRYQDRLGTSKQKETRAEKSPHTLTY
jgi:hypothetical protein